MLRPPRWFTGAVMENEISVLVQGKRHQFGSLQRLRSSASLTATDGAHQSDVLLAVDLEGDRRPHAACKPSFEIRDFHSIVCTIGEEMTVTANLKNQIACCGESSTTTSSAAVCMPSFFLSYRIPREKRAALS